MEARWVQLRQESICALGAAGPLARALVHGGPAQLSGVAPRDAEHETQNQVARSGPAPKQLPCVTLDPVHSSFPR